jgi:sodium/bile acid cotransporter 7
MPPARRRGPRPRLDGFTAALFAAIALATWLPARGAAAPALDGLVRAAVMALFFLHGARLSRDTVLRGLANLRLQGLVLACTFLLFPLLGWLLLGPAAQRLGLEPTLVAGLVFLCCLPSTVQSSIALTAVARGNVAAAVCAASASNLLGVLLTPLLTGLLLARSGGASLAVFGSVATLLLLPFVLGQLLQPWLGEWVRARQRWLSLVDRGSVLLMVYAAFGHAVTGGLWSRVAGRDLALLTLLCAALLALVLLLLPWLARRAGLPAEGRTVVLMCGAQKSLVSGVPLANVLFPAALAGPVVLPLMLYHQLQLLACAWLAARRGAIADPGINAGMR